ncbi:SDR family oxidoreductase [Christiangramia forsetii]|uniref:Short-chain dehydrogenase/reductase family protein n=2 Tax=Christiangramia forsetii TaxID=411153 RepID=A0LZK0_CHRFK|nr:SDR family oxidoreductase [Christiangramia forsetii]GGG38489.1 short-chain dehydrogenase [Christiangramia forsetii]CAL65795.1 short-chain dehydrogenase/reductase family protein [Christiangramia forsetii KT0803]
MSISIENKVALVTGANRGIGKAIVKSFIKHGAKKVYLAVRDTGSTKDLEEEFGSKVETLEADLSNKTSIQELANKSKDVEIVVNNAGVGKPHTTIADGVEEDLQKHFDVNVFGLLRVANAFAETLIKNKGALVQMNSVASIKNFPHLSTYSASKAASYSLTQGIRADLGEKGVSVLSVHPGPIDTEMAAEAGFDDPASTETVSEGIVKALKASDFHLFPDEMAKQVEQAYKEFSENVVLADFSE